MQSEPIELLELDLTLNMTVSPRWSGEVAVAVAEDLVALQRGLL